MSFDVDFSVLVVFCAVDVDNGPLFEDGVDVVVILDEVGSITFKDGITIKSKCLPLKLKANVSLFINFKFLLN